KAALKVAVDLASEGLISHAEAVMRVEPSSLDQLLHPTIDPASPRDVIATGLPASPGAATGKVVFTAEEAEKLGSAGEAVILVREETSPEDIRGMDAARGIVTARGGMTSHAAVVARGMGRPCVSGAGGIHIDLRPRRSVRRRGPGPVRPRAHVLRPGADRRRARDDPRRRRSRPEAGAGQDPADAAGRLRLAVQDHGGPAGHHPAAGPAAARVPAA